MIRDVYGRFTNRPSRTPSSIPNLPLHGGKLSSSSSSPDSDSDHWYVFDPTSPEGWGTSQEWTRYSEAIATQAQYGRAARILSGNGLSPYDVVTALPGWDPLLPYGTPVNLGDVLNESAAYQSGPELWMTSGSLTGWLGRGEKDTYRISKSLIGAKAVRVRALPNDGAYLVPKLCVGSASADRLRAALQQVPGTAFAPQVPGTAFAAPPSPRLRLLHRLRCTRLPRTRGARLPRSCASRSWPSCLPEQHRLLPVHAPNGLGLLAVLISADPRRAAFEEHDADTGDVARDVGIGGRAIVDEAEAKREQLIVQRVVDPADRPPVQTFTDQGEINVRAGLVRALGTRPEEQDAIDLGKPGQNRRDPFHGGCGQPGERSHASAASNSASFACRLSSSGTKLVRTAAAISLAVFSL